MYVFKARSTDDGFKKKNSGPVHITLESRMDALRIHSALARALVHYENSPAPRTSYTPKGTPWVDTIKSLKGLIAELAGIPDREFHRHLHKRHAPCMSSRSCSNYDPL